MNHPTRWLLVLSSLSVVVLAATPEPVMPKDWRGWQHVKSMVIADKGHGLYGFHHVYVQPQALPAYKKGSGYAEGAMLAVPFYEVKQADGATTEGALMKVLFMRRDKKATETGGWQFSAFDPTGKAVPLDAKTACFSCHEPRKERAYVFSEWP